MERRLELDSIFRTILGNNHTYFNPPENLKMQYDCIRYTLSDVSVKRADNKAYVTTNGYDVTYMSLDPDSDVPKKLMNQLEMIRPVRYYASDSVHHWVYKIYY